mgnify:CR=1 FL=1
MAGHSHWAGIKHKKGRADKQRSKIFSKISREITVAAKLGDKDPDMNFRLRSAIQLAKSANMPKENVERAISKSAANQSINYDHLRYEGMGPGKISVIVETLTDNKNRTASNIRTIFQKHGGSLGITGVASHNFKQLGIIRIEKKTISEEKILVPGVIDTTTNYVEHPELVAQRILLFVSIVGKDRVIAGSDCGFGTFAGFGAIDPEIAYAKLSTLSNGAS